MKKEDLLSELANVKDITAFRKKAKALHLTVREDSGRESGRQSWRSRSDILSDYARLLEQDGTQGHIPSYFAMKRPASTSSSVRKVCSMKKEDLLSELANVKDITAFRKKAKALHLTVREDSGRESGRQSWRSRSDILSDYARLLEQDG